MGKSFSSIFQNQATYLWVILGSIFLALISQFSITLPWTPIPLTLQTWGVTLLGGLGGSRKGTAAVIAYLIEGCLGLPVFAGGISDSMWVVGAKGGFLISFPFAAYIIGKSIEERRGMLRAFFLAYCAIFGFGALWLSFRFGPVKAIMIGVLPFLSGACIKTGAAIFILKGWNFFNLRKHESN